MHQKLIFVISIAIAVAALIGGGVIVAFYGFTLPSWLLACELAVFWAWPCSAVSRPSCPRSCPSSKCGRSQGAGLVCGGVLAIWLPPQFIASAVFLALGIKLVWTEACRLADAERQAEQAPGTAIVRHAGEAVTAELVRTGGNGTLAARERHGDDAAAPARRRA